MHKRLSNDDRDSRAVPDWVRELSVTVAIVTCVVAAVCGLV